MCHQFQHSLERRWKNKKEISWLKFNMHLYFSQTLRLMSICDFDKWSIKTEKKWHRKNERQPLLRTSRCFLCISCGGFSSDTPNYGLHTGILAIQSINLHLKYAFLHQVHCHRTAPSFSVNMHASLQSGKTIGWTWGLLAVRMPKKEINKDRSPSSPFPAAQKEA